MAKITITDARNEIMGEWIDGDEDGVRDADVCVKNWKLPWDLAAEICGALEKARKAEAAVRERPCSSCGYPPSKHFGRGECP